MLLFYKTRKEEQRIYIKGAEIIKLLRDLGGHNTLSYNLKNEAFPFIKEFYKEISLPRWEPKYEEFYYFIDDMGTIITSMWMDTRVDNLRYEFGNCFSTSEEAEVAKDKIRNLFN